MAKGPTCAVGKTGIFGGTFNPVHIAHLILAEEIRERLGLDRVLFVPSGFPPHKKGDILDGRLRLAMIRAAVRGNPRFSALDLEVKRGGRSYTIETLRELRASSSGPESFYFLIGMDAFQEITTWREADSLADYAHFAVFPRPGYPLEKLSTFFPRSWKKAPATRRRGGVKKISLQGKHALFTVPVEPLAVSASSIRRRIREGLSVRYLLPGAVEKYIISHDLYRKNRKGD